MEQVKTKSGSLLINKIDNRMNKLLGYRGDVGVFSGIYIPDLM